MEGKTATFKRSDQVVTLDTKAAIKVDGVTVQIDPQLLFQRLTIAAKASDKRLKTYSSMSSAVIHQPSLIHHCCLESHRSQYWLCHWDSLMQDSPGISGEVQEYLERSSLC